jgi:hypothetical protein
MSAPRQQARDHARAVWRAHFEKYGWTPAEIELALTAAGAAIAQGASADEIDQAGAAAVNRDRQRRAAQSRQAHEPAPASPRPAPSEQIKAAAPSAARIGPAPRGTIVGVARRVQQTTQFGGRGSNLQVLNFELVPPGARPVRVQIRGAVLNGTVNDGDEIVVKQPKGDSGFVQADCVFNRTTNSEVKAPKGFLASFGVGLMEAQFGKRAALFVRAVVIVFFIIIICVLFWGAFSFIKTHINNAPSPPAWDNNNNAPSAPAWHTNNTPSPPVWSPNNTPSPHAPHSNKAPSPPS